MILHVAIYEEWKAFEHLDHYAPGAFSAEGFIHCCTPSQLEGVLHRYFQGKRNLVLLHIDESGLDAPLRYEAATGGELFPHVYGKINKTAIVRTEKMR